MGLSNSLERALSEEQVSEIGQKMAAFAKKYLSAADMKRWMKPMPLASRIALLVKNGAKPVDVDKNVTAVWKKETGR